MSYDFSFDKKTVTFLLGGFAFVGIMLFIAGLLVGTNWRGEPPAVAAATVVQPAAATPAPAQQAPAPQQPVAKSDAVKPEADAPLEVAAPSESPAPIKQAHAIPSIESIKEPSPPPVEEADSEVKVIERAKPSAAADDLNKTDQLTYSVQVGIFMDKNEANQLVRQLRNKGFAPIVLSAADSGDRWWYSVRIGAYTNSTDAAEAASKLARQEKVKTVVRPLGAL